VVPTPEIFRYWLQGGRVERAGAEGEARLNHRPPAG
jgi:hypothetical protein